MSFPLILLKLYALRYLNNYERCNWHITKCMFLKYTVWEVLTYVCTHETIKIMNIFLTPVIS